MYLVNYGWLLYHFHTFIQSYEMSINIMKIQSFPLSGLFSERSFMTKILSWKKKRRQRHHSPMFWIFFNYFPCWKMTQLSTITCKEKLLIGEKHLYVIKNTLRFCSTPIRNPFCLIFRNSRRKLYEKKISSIKVYFTSLNMALPWPRFWKRVPSLHVIGMAHHSSGIFFP